MPLALAYREALQLCPTPSGVAADVLQQRQGPPSLAVENVELDDATQQHVMKRSAWLQAYWRYRVRRAQHSEKAPDFFSPCGSSGEWQKAFEAIAKTWGRLLSLVGLRR